MEGGDQDPDGVDTQANEKEEYHAGQTNSCMKNQQALVNEVYDISTKQATEEFLFLRELGISSKEFHKMEIETKLVKTYKRI